VHGLLLARVSPGESWFYGDRIRIEGNLETPSSSETFDYQEYLAHQNIYSVMNNARGIVLLHNQANPLLSAIYTIRQSALEHIYEFFPDPEASLMAGILLGIRTGIPSEIDDAFRDTGTSHIIAISGFNISILAGLFTFVFCKILGRRYGLILTIVAIVLYTIMVGAGAAVVRAAFLAGLGLFGYEVGRRQTGVNSLAIIAAFMVLIFPGTLWDIGFQLSFAATLGLILYADLFLESFNKVAGKLLPPESLHRLAGPVGAYFLFTLAAQVTTLPLTMYYSGNLSLSALIANPLVLPAQPPLMVTGGISTLVGFLSTTLGQWLAYVTWPFPAYTIRIVEWLAGFSAGVLHTGRIELPLLLLYYFSLFGWSFVRWLKAKEAALTPGEDGREQTKEKPGRLLRTWIYFSQRPWLPLLAISILTVFTWRAVLSAPSGKMEITILNVGSGEAILIRTPDGRNLLINGGSSGLALADALGRRLPPEQRHFDWWVVANGDEESVAGLSPILDRYPSDHVLWAGPTHGSYASRQLWEKLTEKSIPVTLAENGHELKLGEGASLQILVVSSRGATLLLTWENFRLLMPIGIDFDAIEELRPQISPLSALLLAESGYAPLNPDSWLKTLAPQVVFLSVAADDRQGLPDHEVLDSLKGYTVLRTDQNGWIELTTDGEQMWVEVEQK
jgi:competence protein ComEC